jgi:hypothetical protein
MLKEELAANVEHLIGGMRQQGEWPRSLKGSHEVSEVVREDRPTESGKRPGTPSKAPLIGKEGIEYLSHS